MRESHLLERGMQMVEFYRENPTIAAFDLLRVDLATPQRVVLTTMWDTPYVIVAAARGFGKTFILAVFSVLRCLLYPGIKVGWISATFRQSKYIFQEAAKLYDQSPIFRAACEKPPTRLQEVWYIKMKGLGTLSGGGMESVPLGDGNKIRGMRAHILCCDEFPQIPEEIFDRVVLPMAAVRHDPMARVRLKQREKEAREAGVLGEEEDLFDNIGSFNKIIIASSAYFKFNHLYRRYLSYVDRIKKGDNKYAVLTIPYYDMPEYFYEDSIIDFSQQQQSDLEFRMEYLAEFISDSEGFYKASLLKECEGKFNVELKGRRDCRYVMGVDPARTEDACGIVIVKLDDPTHVVFADQLVKKTFQQMSDYVFKLADAFDLSGIYMDAGPGGGGTAVRDLLTAGQGLSVELYEPIVEVDSPIKGRK